VGKPAGYIFGDPANERADMMFTLEQINAIHDTLGNAESLAQYVKALSALGVETYDSYIMDGHSEYVGKNGHMIISPPAHETITIADTSNKEQFLKHLDLHNQGKTSYVEMSKGLAESGIEKWTVDTTNVTMTFYDKLGNEMLAETIS
jgi:uncharacterized protein YbcV (DUF1398 family)